MGKLKSRKLWICIAAFLGSIAASIAGLQTGNQVIATVGVIAGILSAAIYAFCEAWVDSSAAGSSVTINNPTLPISLEENKDDET